MRIPPPLQPGDRIGLTCTARKISREEIEPAMVLLENWGLDVAVGRTVGLSDHQFAGSDRDRAADMQQFLNDPSIRTVLACRGGYGTARMMDRLDYTRFMDHPKWIAGYSDLTILHSHLNSVMGVASLHSTMPVNFPTNSEASLSSMRNVLFGQPNVYEWGPNSLNRTGSVEAGVVGGNLSMIYSLLGTRTGMITTGKILFLEDLDEYLYHIDRMMVSLKRAGKLERLAALVVGSMTDMNDNTIPFGKSAREIIAEHVEGYDYPVCFDFPAGHIADNRALILGGKARLHVRPTGCLFEQ